MRKTTAFIHIHFSYNCLFWSLSFSGVVGCFTDGGVIKNPPSNAGSPGEGNGNPLQCSCLENPMDRGAWRAMVCGVAKVMTVSLSTHTELCYLYPLRPWSGALIWLPNKITNLTSCRQMCSHLLFVPWTLGSLNVLAPLCSLPDLAPA